MATAAEIAGVPVTVTIEKRLFTLTPMTVSAELGWLKYLDKLAHRDNGERDDLTWRRIMRCPDPEGRAEMYREFVREIKRGDPVSFAVTEEARRSPDGVARELYLRTRLMHADVTEADIRALVTDENAGAVADAIIDGLTRMNPNAPAP